MNPMIQRPTGKTGEASVYKVRGGTDELAVHDVGLTKVGSLSLAGMEGVHPGRRVNPGSFERQGAGRHGPSSPEATPPDPQRRRRIVASPPTVRFAPAPARPTTQSIPRSGAGAGRSSPGNVRGNCCAATSGRAAQAAYAPVSRLPCTSESPNARAEACVPSSDLPRYSSPSPTGWTLSQAEPRRAANFPSTVGCVTSPVAAVGSTASSRKPLSSRRHTFSHVAGLSNRSTATTLSPTATASPAAPSGYGSRSAYASICPWYAAKLSAIAAVGEETPSAACCLSTSSHTLPWSER